ncbi:MAG TPA: hypothetical protein VGR30_16795, partial [Candidatus Binatia bacterium]|nr:hypothetical protein [Candidatus Binatia bacterium]
MMPQQSPLFIPALWQGNGFKILDETLLPWKVEYLTAHDVSEAIQVVREMKTRAFGQVLTFFYSAVFVAREDGGNDLASLKLRLKQLADEFTRARPTFDFGGLGRLLESWLA